MQEEDDYEEVDLKGYQQLVGKLMYLSCSTRPNITFVVDWPSRQNADPRMGYLKTTKKVLWYLKGTMHPKLTYKNVLQLINQTKALMAPESYGFIEYAGSKYAGDHEDCKLVIRYYFYLNRALISWCSKRQQTLLTSTTEAKYIAFRYVAKKSL